MSEDEKRALKGAVLLEAEEAREALALLRAKSEQWYREHEKVTNLLARARRDGAALEAAANEARAVIARDLDGVARTMDLAAVLALDDEIVAALARLRRAEAAKKQLFG